MVWNGVTIMDTIIGLGSFVWPKLQKVEVPMSTTVSVIMVATGVLGFMAPRVWDRWKLRRLQSVLPGYWGNRDDADDWIRKSTAHSERLQARKPIILKEMGQCGSVPEGEMDMLIKRGVDRHDHEVVTLMLAEYRRHREGSDGYLEEQDLYHEDTFDIWLADLAELEEQDPDPDFDPFGFLEKGAE